MGVHGAGLTNLAFQPQGAHVVELMAPMCGTAAYWIMSRPLGKSYHGLVCEDPEFGIVDQLAVTHNPQNNRRDVIVPIDQLDELLSGLD
jgi:capsular polysaccharide biosynthesis protein